MINGVKTIAICTAEVHNEDTQEIMYPLIKHLREQDFAVLVFAACTQLFSNNPFDRGEAAVYSYIPFEQVDVVFVLTHVINNHDIVREIVKKSNFYNTPVVVYNLEDHIDGAININFDEGDAFGDLVTHVVDEHDVKSVRCIAGVPGNSASEGRLTVLKSILKSRGIAFDEELDMGYGYFYEEPTRKVVRRFLDDPRGLPDAIICVNDSMAIETVNILNANGYMVPEDVIVTGFDGTMQERYSQLRLCTCKRDMASLAKTLGKVIINAEKGEVQSDDIRIPYIFTPGPSCGCSLDLILNETVNQEDIFLKIYYSNRWESNTTYMNSKLSVSTTAEEMTRCLEHYTNADTVICTYKGMDFNGELPDHIMKDYDRSTMSCRFFPAEQGAPCEFMGEFEESAVFPGIERRIRNRDALVYFSIHGEDHVAGYVVYEIDTGSYVRFGSTLNMNQKFSSGLDTAISMFLMQESLRKTNEYLISIQNKIISGFSELVESRDDSTGQHIKRVSEYMRILCNRLAEEPEYSSFLNNYTINLIYKAAPLHDVGKIKISDVILNKPGRLTTEEFEVIKTHTTEGYNIIRALMSGLEDDDYIEIAQEVALYHHEKWDGSGYPTGLSGADIPLSARLMAIVDVFDALSSKRVYKDAYSLDETFDIIEKSAGSHFDPTLVDAFLSVRSEIEEKFKEINQEQ